MSDKTTLGQLYSEYKAQHNLEAIYQPQIENNILRYVKVGTFSNNGKILLKTFNTKHGTITAYSLTYKKSELNDLGIVGIIELVITEDTVSDKLLFAAIPIDTDKHHHRYVVMQEQEIVKEFKTYPGNDKIIREMVNILLE